ncbi:hydrolase [Streptomyces sp. CC53]|uniref:HAD family hydrolase n=1 Tax=unclassified Streptomyces TaxID=2593676 RepID=UPI0008DCA847|nr:MULTISPECIES: HAD-IA family hydrolase [unclassified Streptomyces]OII65687.1 hydrolase [Streptomyces sp. CC53]
MAVTGVLFDFSGTLFRAEPADDWLRAVVHAAGADVPPDALKRWARRLSAAGAQPGVAPPGGVPPHLAAAWAVRDRSAAEHRAAYTALAREVELPDPAWYPALYDRHMAPEAWHPYPDAEEVLVGLRARGVAVGVVSNIGWDLRPVFAARGWDRFVDAYALSYEHGVQKPDARLFRVACAALGREPGELLMVGDDRRADGGAAALGCAVHFVDHLPVAQRPGSLRPVLDLAV